MIRAVIFDLGGVLLRTMDFTPRERLASRLGMNRSALEELIFDGESGDRAQRGEISVEKHWKNLANRLGFTLPEVKALIDEFFANDVLDHQLVDYVRRLHKRYKTALLSNNWDDLRQVIEDRWCFEDAFDELIISAEVGLVKPDPRIFQLAIERLGVEADQAVFVDDMPRNIAGAAKLGLRVILFQTPAQTQQDLERMLDGYTG